MKLHYECIEPVLAFGKDSARMLSDDAFGDGKTKSVAVVHLPCFISSVKAFEDVFQCGIVHGLGGVAPSLIPLSCESSTSEISLGRMFSNIDIYRFFLP